MPTIALSGGGGRLAAPSPLGGTARPQLERAALLIYEPVQQKPKPPRAGAEITRLPFQFNPKEVAITKSATWQRNAEKQAANAGPVEFKGTQPCKLTLDMLFDATGKPDGSVVAAVEVLLSCCTPTPRTVEANQAMAPLVALEWGRTRGFLAFVTQVSAKYTLFASDGTPVRAQCSVSLEELPTAAERQNPTSGGRAVRRTHLLLEGESLQSVAYREYGDPALWRPLAQYNGIDDPMRVPVGTRLLLPLPDEFVAEPVLVR